MEKIIELEYSVNYQSYILKFKTDIVNISNDINNNNLIKLNPIKELLNNTKNKIDKYQLKIPKKELLEKYGTEDLYQILRIKKLDKNIKNQIKKNIFYDKLTDKIYMMNFKHLINIHFNLQNVSNAGLKLTEILNHENIIDKTKTSLIHFANAEMPGNFIVAINYYLKTNAPDISYDWYGNSLLPGVMGPNSKGLPDYYGFYKKYRNKWIMNENKMNGDITNINNIEYIKNYFTQIGKCDLYTSDAGISLDIYDFNDQEIIEIKLKLSEILCGLISLKENGNMVIKIYTFFEKITIDILIILSKLFKTLKIVKPMTSKPTNSENYIIGLNYIGYENSLKYIDIFIDKINNFNNYGFLSNIHIDDISLLYNILNTIYNKQILFINRNLYYFEKYYYDSFTNYNIINDIYITYIKKLIEYYYEKYIEENNLKPMLIKDNL